MNAQDALDVIGIGYCVWDYLGIVARMPEFDGPTLFLEGFAACGGGPVATALVALTRLGARSGYLGVIGDDDIGRNIQQAFLQEGVDVSHLRIEAGAQSSPCMILVEAKSGKRAILHSRGTYSQLQLQPEDHAYITSAKFLHLDGQHMSAAILAAQWMHQAGGTVVLDATRPRPRLEELLPLVDVLITNATFTAEYTGEADRKKAATRLLSHGPTLVVNTLGEQGCECYTRRRSWYVAGFHVQVVDTTGAGDAFHGGFIYGLLHGWPVRRTATFANAVAALNCTALGGQAGLPSLTQVEAFLKNGGPVRTTRSPTAGER